MMREDDERVADYVWESAIICLTSIALLTIKYAFSHSLTASCTADNRAVKAGAWQ